MEATKHGENKKAAKNLEGAVKSLLKGLNRLIYFFIIKILLRNYDLINLEGNNEYD